MIFKLVAYDDRKDQRDLASVVHCLRHYCDEDDRRYGLDHGTQAVPWEFTTALLLGQDGRPTQTAALRAIVSRVLDQFDAPDAVLADLAAGADAGYPTDDEGRHDVFDLFRWFRAGAGL